MQINKLSELLSKHNIESTSEQTEKLCAYLNAVWEANKSLNLVGFSTEEEYAEAGIIDSLTLLKHIPDKPFSLLDVGTGSGLPGVPLQIMRPDYKVTILDSDRKKLSLLCDLNRNLGLGLEEIIEGRAEELGHDEKYRDKYDITTAKAFAPFTVMVEVITPFLKPGGHMIALRGYEDPEVMRKAIEISQRVGCATIGVDMYKQPGTGKNCLVVSTTKSMPTPELFPRKWNQLIKNCPDKHYQVK